jgi:hypothetical protein
MNFSYYDLPNNIQGYLASRFGAYGLDPVLAYDYLLPEEIKSQGAEAIEEFMRHKHISHIYPQSGYSEMANDLSNIFLEDPTENLIRGNRIATHNEVQQAQLDNFSDSFDGDFNDNGILDNLEVFFGM